MNPSTPQNSAKAGPLGKFLNKIRTPTIGDGASPNKAAAHNSSFATPTFLRRRSSSRASTNRLRMNEGIPSGSLESLSPMAMPQFETEDWQDWLDNDKPESAANRSSSYLQRLPTALPSTSTLTLSSLASASSLSLASQSESTARPALPPSSTSISQLSSAAYSSASLASFTSNNSTDGPAANGSAKDGGSLSKSMSRGWAKSKEMLLSRSIGGASSSKDQASPTPAIEYVDSSSQLEDLVSPPPMTSSLRTRAPLARLGSDDRVLSSSQPSSALSNADSTPGVPRAGLHGFATQSLRLKRSLLAKQETATTQSLKPRRAQRVLVSEVQQQEQAREEDGNEGGSEGGEPQSASPDVSSAEKESKSLARLPPPSPGFHGRSRSDLVPSSPKHRPAERTAATLTISSSTSLASTSTISTYAQRRAANATITATSSTALYESFRSSSRQSQSDDTDSSPVESHKPRLGSRSTLKPESSAALRQRILRSSSAPDATLSPPSENESSSSSSSPPIPEVPEPRSTSSLEFRRAQVVERTAAQLAENGGARASLDERRTSTSPRLVPYHSRTSSASAAPSSPTEVPTSRPQGALWPRALQTQASTIVRPSSRESTYRDQENTAPATATMRPGLRPLYASSSLDTVSDQENQQPSARPPSQQSTTQDENRYRPTTSQSTRNANVPFPSTAPLQATSRPVLGETFRATNATSTATARPGKHAPSYPKERVVVPEYHVPVKDSSPGLGEATPSGTMQQHHYSSQQASQSQQQHSYQPVQSHQQYQQQQQQHYQAQSMDTQVPTKRLKDAPKSIFVNGKQYNRAGILGRGGSSRVYRVIDQSNNLFAIKRVDMSKNDPETKASFLNEISLLEKLRGHPQIIQLVDSEMNESRKQLFMVMEVGETDLNNLLAEHAGKSISMNFIRYIWEQMLEAVQVMHNENVVHTDLKPANFVLVKGRLKLIDFGISKAIANDTTNIGRDQQIGTANYMPPESLMDSGLGLDGKKLMKLGRPADVWSLGCILHQMAYGRTPFAHISNLQAKIVCIQNPEYKFSFPSYTCPTDERGQPRKDLAVKIGPDLIDTIKSCLIFESKQRATIPDLLKGDFLRKEGSEMHPKPSADRPTIDDATMAALVQRIASITGNPVGCEEGRKLARKLMMELRATQE